MESTVNPADRGNHMAPLLDTLIDLIQSAWQLEDDQMEQLLELAPGWLAKWRVHEAPEFNYARVHRLVSFHDALRLHARPGRYDEYIRRVWKPESPIGARSILDALLSDGDHCMDLIAQYLRYQG